MLRLTLKNLRANKVRFALTTFGVVLAVSFVVSAFVLADGLRSTFGDVSEEITAGVDLEVRPVTDFGEPIPLSLDLLDDVAAVDGVADAVPAIESAADTVRVIPGDGETISTEGAPQLAFNWSENESVSPFLLVDGQAPTPDEFVLDLDSAEKHDFVIGDTYDFITPSGPVSLTLSGTSSFGADNNTVGAVLMGMNTAQAGEIFDVAGLNTIQVELEPGADSAAVQAEVAAAVPTAEVVNQATVEADTANDFNGQVDIIGNILLGFGMVSLFVSVFIIYNTFAIVLGQRTKELALLRTIGASSAQIRKSVLGEALVIGVLASVGGLVGGVGVAKGLEALFNATGATLPDSPTILAARTVIAALVIGIGVTMLAAIGPSRKAASVPPIAAMRDGVNAGAPGSRTRFISGLALFGLGVASGGFGLAGVGETGMTILLMAIGAVSVFLGVTLLSPMAVGPVTRFVGWPMKKMSGVAGGLAQKNAARNSRRTATTAAALMIGLALVTTALVVGQSMKSTFGSTMDKSVQGDYFVTNQLDEVEFPSEVTAGLDSLDLVSSVTGFRYAEARVDGAVTSVVAADLEQLPELLNLDLQDGGFSTEEPNSVLISADHAETSRLEVGDTVTAEFATGTVVTASITGVFADESIITESYLLDTATFTDAGVDVGDEWLTFAFGSDVSGAEIDSTLESLAVELPDADIETAEQFRDRVVGMIDQLLSIVNVMVALAVVIALIGIANTLALSVFERTRELGLLRAVGMTRRQLRRMVRFEAALVATFGAVLGVAVGLLLAGGLSWLSHLHGHPQLPFPSNPSSR